MPRFVTKSIFSLSLCLCLTLFFSCQKPFSNPENPKAVILVSIPPYCYFVERIAGSDVQVQTIVPIGANPHLFEPSPRQVEWLSKAKLWFYIGESFEQKIMLVLKEQNPELKMMDVKKNIPLLCNAGHSHCFHTERPSHAHREASDLHIWLSPRLAKEQAKNIAESLIELFPEKRELYLKNLQQFLFELEELDADIQSLLKPMIHRAILVSHPAFGYFCRDYDLTQLSVECEGKDPLPRNIALTLEQAQNLEIKNVILQPQYNNKGAEIIAGKLNLPCFTLDPYSLDYISNLRHIAATIAASE